MNRVALGIFLTIAAYQAGQLAGNITYPAGDYKVTTTGPTRVTSGEGWVKIEWDVEPSVPDKPSPPVVKPPDPGIVPVPSPVVPPAPTPAPTVAVPILSGPIWIAAVYDRTTAGGLPAGQQALLLSKTISASMAKVDATWSSWDKTAKELQDTTLPDGTVKEGWWSSVKVPLPAVLVIWAQGNKSQSWPLPADETAMLTFAGKLRGQ